jgi:hypothetical protein
MEWYFSDKIRRMIFNSSSKEPIPEYLVNVPTPHPLRNFSALTSRLASAEQNEILGKILFFMRHFEHAPGLPEPLLIVLDTNLIRSITHVDESEERKSTFIALAAFLSFLRNRTPFKIGILLSPVMFYEFIGRRLISQKDDYIKGISSLYATLSPFDIPIYQFGLSNFREMGKNLYAIDRDFSMITKVYNDVVTVSKGAILERSKRQILPIRAAADLIPYFKLQYFNRLNVEIVFASILERAILSNKSTDKYLRSYFRDDRFFKYASLLKRRGDRLQGIGDVYLIDLCNITAQSSSNTPITITGLTLDENLAAVLSMRSELHVRSSNFIGGEELSDTERKFTDYMTRVNQMNGLSQFTELYNEAFFQFIWGNEMSWLTILDEERTKRRTKNIGLAP